MEEHVRSLAQKAEQAATGIEAQQFADAAEKVAHAYSCVVHTNDEADERKRKWAADDRYEEREQQRLLKAEEARQTNAAADVEKDSAQPESAPTKPGKPTSTGRSLPTTT